MEEIYYTLQDFLFHTESIVYILMFFILVGMLGFWLFLSARDEE